jgi:hypothetical protein
LGKKRCENKEIEAGIRWLAMTVCFVIHLLFSGTGASHARFAGASQCVQPMSTSCRNAGLCVGPPLKPWKEESMSKSTEQNGPRDDAAPLVVQVEGAFAGLAVRDCGRYRFLSLHPGFNLLDGSRFTRPEEIGIAAKRLARAAKG